MAIPLAWLGALAIYAWITGWDKTAPIWMLVVFFGKMAAFWLVYAFYRIRTRGRPKPPVPTFCGNCHAHAPLALGRPDGGYEFQCHNCRAINVSIGVAEARVVH